MQTPAKISLVFTDFPPIDKQFAEPQRATSYRRFYQQVGSRLVKDAYAAKQIFRALGDRLVVLAEHAHAFRQMDTLEQVSESLVSLPSSPEYKAIGRYYQALCIQRFGLGDVRSAQRLLEQVADSPSPKYRARALISLGATWRTRCDNQSALHFYREACRLVSRSGLYDPYATIHAQKMVAVINSDEENHRGALTMLENLFPLAHTMRLSQPHVYYDYLNSLAVELCEAGRLEEADNISRIVLASPFAGAYPEWRETRNEIALMRRRPSRATVAFSQRNLEAPNVLRLLAPERDDSVADHSSVEGKPARVLSMQQWKKKMRKQPASDPQDEMIPVPATEEEKRARLRELEKLTTRDKLLRIMKVIGDERVGDDELLRALIILEGVEQKKNSGS